MPGANRAISRNCGKKTHRGATRAHETGRGITDSYARGDASCPAVPPNQALPVLLWPVGCQLRLAELLQVGEDIGGSCGAW